MREQVVRLGQPPVRLGIVTEPAGGWDAAAGPAFLFLNSGILHRVGPNRLHVTLARELAREGFGSLRLDLSGIGDSPAAASAPDIGAQWLAEIGETLDFLEATHGVREFVILGNCSGAALALVAAARDPRVVGAALVNLQGSRTYLRYYIRLALTSRAFWRRVFAGSARYRDLFTTVRGLVTELRGARRQEVEAGGAAGSAPARAAGEDAPPSAPADGGGELPDIDDLLATLAERRTRLLVVYCGWDPALDYFRVTLRPALRRHVRAGQAMCEVIPGMNHDLHRLYGQERLRELVRDWARTLRPAPVTGDG